MHSETFFFQAFVYLLAAVISVPLAKRLGLGSVLGYLIAGVFIGPFVLGLVGEERTDVMHFAEFGVVMMLFLVGLELQPSLLWKMRGPIIGLGGLQVVLTAGAVTLIAWLLGLAVPNALAIGLILALSSTAIVLQTLKEKGLLQTDAGRASFSVLLLQDIAVIPILALMPLLAQAQIDHTPETSEAVHASTSDVNQVQTDTHGQEEHHAAPSLTGWRKAALVLATVAVIILAGRFLMRHVFRFIAETRLPDVFTAAALLLVIGIALAMQRIGLSPALGTFLAGVVLANNEYRHELEGDIEPFKGLLLGLFFISVGASIDFQLLLSQPLLILGIVVGLVIVKFCVLFLLGTTSRMPLSERFLFSFSLAQGSEFAFVLLSFAATHHVLSKDITSPMVVAVALSMLATPLLMIVNDKLIQPRFRGATQDREPDKIPENENQVIIAGFGRFGQIAGRLLLANGIKPTVLDHDPTQIEALRRFGHRVFYGDAARLDLLHAASAEQAKLLIIAVDDTEAALQIVDTARRHFPHLVLLARAHDRLHAHKLIKSGVQVIRRETFDSALAMGRAALKHLGFHAYQAQRLAQIFDKHDRLSLQEMGHMIDDEKAYITESRRQTRELENLLKAEQTDPDISSDRAWDTTELNENLRQDRF